MRIAYLLFTHRHPEQVARLVDRLRGSRDAFVLVHHDAKSPPLSLARRDDVHVIEDPRAVRWGDLSQVRASLHALDWLEGAHVSFDWVLTLSGQDYPAQPLRATERDLAGADHDGFLSHVPVPPRPRGVESAFQRQMRTRYYGRPVEILGRRLRLPRRHPYRRGLSCYAGASWLNLSRAAVEYVWRARALRDTLLAYLEGVPSPDETFFQTLLLASRDLRFRPGARRYLRWRPGAAHPEILTGDDVPEILASGAFFARKFDETRQPGVLDVLDEALACRP